MADRRRGAVCGLGDGAAGAGVVLRDFFPSLFPPPDDVIEVAAAADGLRFFERFDTLGNPLDDLSFPAHDGNVPVVGRNRITVVWPWIHPAGGLAAAIFESDTILEGGLLIARDP